MIEADDQLRHDLNRLARSLVPDGIPGDTELLLMRYGSSSERPDTDEPLVHVGEGRRPRRGVLAAAAAVLLLVLCP